MSARDQFSVYLRELPEDGVGFEAIEDGRHILHITQDVALFIRPSDDLPAAVAGLEKLAEAAWKMAGALRKLAGER